MSKFKFKIGDKVIVIRAVDEDDNLFIGKTGTVEEDDDVPFVMMDSGRRKAFVQSQLELEVVYNSPLYQALKEEDE